MRTFTCQACKQSWGTNAKGNFRTCPSCKESAETAKRTKQCLYCKNPFKDDTVRLVRRYCSEECQYRAKATRAGLVTEEGFLADRVLQCLKCTKDFTPVRANQVYCGDECRLATYSDEKLGHRYKICPISKEPFFDESPKNNRQFTDQVARERVNKKVGATRLPGISKRTEERRFERVRSGDGGRVDDIGTLRKYTATWWGRASEVIFAAYRPSAADMVVLAGNKSPYDFQDPEFGRVDVRGGVEEVSPQGRSMWTVDTTGLHLSADYVFLVGFNKGKTNVRYLWLFSTSESVGRFAPGSCEYRGGQWDISEKWGLAKANETLASLHALPEPDWVLHPIEDRYAWLDDPVNFATEAPAHIGRRGELLYRRRYPTSKDLNREFGPTYPYDFLDSDGTKVNVKTSLPDEGRLRWRFSLGDAIKHEHRCDMYACLGLNASGDEVFAEYRIPAHAWGSRKTINIYENGREWEEFRVHEPVNF